MQVIHGNFLAVATASPFVGTDVFRLSIWLLLLMIIFVPLERLFAVHPHKVFRKSLATDLGYYFLSSLVPKMLLVIPMAVIAWGLHYVVPGPCIRG